MITSKCFPLLEPIYEFGALQVPGQEIIADLRPIFPGCDYVGVDMCEGPGVDRVLDLQSIDLPSESVGSVLCLDTLEHVEHPHQALREIYRILSPTRGVVVITSVMDFPIHDYPYDFWRFTPTAFESLLKPFSHSFIGFAGKKDFPHTVVGVGFKGDVPDLSVFKEKYQQWQKAQKDDLMQVIIQITPRALIPSYSTLTELRKIFRRSSKSRC
jgi:ubiquinone/menaquinone biosynthesis C-methylase UbiE